METQNENELSKLESFLQVINGDVVISYEQCCLQKFNGKTDFCPSETTHALSPKLGRFAQLVAFFTSHACTCDDVCQCEVLHYAKLFNGFLRHEYESQLAKMIDPHVVNKEGVILLVEKFADTKQSTATDSQLM